METRRYRTALINDQENVYAIKGKANIVPGKKTGQGLRGALGDLNTNVQAQRDLNIGKVAVTAAEFEKKATCNRGPLKSNYSHVQSKVDTGLPSKNVIQPSSRPPLRREESTANLAARAVARAKTKDTKSTEVKESINVYFQTKKIESKKVSKLPAVKENKEVKTLKPILKESTETLGKLKLDDKTSLINYANLVEKAPSLDTTPELPDDIEDVDREHLDNPLLMAIYIKDIYRYLTHLEEKYPVEPSHLSNQNEITGKMRATLIDWLVEVQRQFSLLSETLQLTVGIIDRYLQASPNVARNRLQLVGVTAMFIAAKYEEIYAPDVSDFVYVTDRAYSKHDVFRCERDIMTKLGFCLARPIPLSFLRRFVNVARGTSKNHHLAKYIVELSLQEYALAHCRPSQLAAAALCLSLHALSADALRDVWTPKLSYYSGYTLDKIEPIIRKMAEIITNARNSKFKAVYNKYLDPTLAKVSSLPQLKSEAMFELAKLASSPE